MAKYSYEFKLKVVQAYLNAEGGYRYLASKYNIPSKTRIEEWVSIYKEFGKGGLLCSKKNKNYSFQFKLFVVQLYLTSEVSYKELAHSQRIKHPSTITRWVNAFRMDGPDALRPKKKGCKKFLNMKEINKNTTRITGEKSLDTSAEHIKQLEEENLKLRIENAYLKELRRLRLEKESLLKKQRESSTVSEDSSN